MALKDWKKKLENRNKIVWQGISKVGRFTSKIIIDANISTDNYATMSLKRAGVMSKRTGGKYITVKYISAKRRSLWQKRIDVNSIAKAKKLAKQFMTKYSYDD